MHLTLYHLVQSRSQRILWLLEELNLNYAKNNVKAVLQGRVNSRKSA